MHAIEVKDVIKRYADHLALDKVSLTVARQSIYGLLGPNGAGKTTLIRILNQITAPDSGEVLLNGKRLQREHIARIGYLPEERGLYKKMKVGEQAVYLAQLKGISKNDAEKRLKAWFDKFEIGAWWNKKIEELSKGMQQKIQFITTVIHEPDILVFDEPFSGFDPINANLLKESMLELRDRGATILLSTHNMSSVEELCDSITLINKGRTIVQGAVQDIKRQHDTHRHEIIIETEHPEALNTLTERYNMASERLGENGPFHLTLVNVAPNEALHEVLNIGRLVSYRDILPSMNDIFISEVQSQNHIS